jgi:DNA (cytosine-5)-methyltransferase 1
MFNGLRVIRHRLFETNFPILTPVHGRHPICHTFDKRKSQYGKTNEMRDFVSVNGGGNCSVIAARSAMGIDWMTKNELNEAIPPAYTRLIGEQLINWLAGKETRVAAKASCREAEATSRIQTETDLGASLPT